MNFFEAQERARRASNLLIIWFLLALVSVVASTYLLGIFLLNSNQATESNQLTWWDPQLFLWNGIIVGGVIIVGSLVKNAQLSAGGKVVAQSLSGRPVDPSTIDLRERRLLNVVEEMAIASGISSPEVWILDEERGINAFAAGTDPSNAVIGVTSGTLNRLNRAELQGVVAHEFSHILNGDMKLNIRLMGWVFGLVMLSGIGSHIIRMNAYSGSSKKNSNGVIFLIGAGVWLIGWVGVLAARLIQAGISRQREYLADASAVQFTRDVTGISGALKKIGGFSDRGRIRSSHASEAQHMFFTRSSFGFGMRTHPPLEKRIAALDYRWSGKMVASEEGGSSSGINDERISGFSGNDSGELTVSGVTAWSESDRLDTRVGQLIRSDLRAGKVTSFSKDEAKFLLLGLLYAADDDHSDGPHPLLSPHGFHENEVACIKEWSAHFKTYTTSKKLAVVDLSLSWLRRMTQGEAVRFIEASKALIEADGQIDLFEFMLQKVIERHVEIGLGLRLVPKIRFQKMMQLEMEIATVLATFRHLAGNDRSIESAAEEYQQHTGRPLPLLKQDLTSVGEALDTLDSSTPLVKHQVIRLCGLVVIDDGKVTDRELELLRATAEAMGAPIPPMVQIEK